MVITKAGDCHLTLMYRSDYQIVTLRTVATIWARTTDAILLVQRPPSPSWRHKKGRHYLSTVAGNWPKCNRSKKNGRPGAQIGHWRFLLPPVGRIMQTCSTLHINLQRSDNRPDSLYQGFFGFVWGIGLRGGRFALLAFGLRNILQRWHPEGPGRPIFVDAATKRGFWLLKCRTKLVSSRY